MSGNMNKVDIPCRTASLTFTIDNILNLKQNKINLDAQFSKVQTDSGRKNDFQLRYHEDYDVQRRQEPDVPQEPGELFGYFKINILV